MSRECHGAENGRAKRRVHSSAVLLVSKPRLNRVVFGTAAGQKLKCPKLLRLSLTTHNVKNGVELLGNSVSESIYTVINLKCDWIIEIFCILTLLENLILGLDVPQSH